MGAKHPQMVAKQPQMVAKQLQMEENLHSPPILHHPLSPVFMRLRAYEWRILGFSSKIIFSYFPCKFRRKVVTLPLHIGIMCPCVSTKEPILQTLYLLKTLHELGPRKSENKGQIVGAVVSQCDLPYIQSTYGCALSAGIP